MAITLATNARNAVCDGIVDLLDVGGAGNLQVATSNAFTTVLATITLSSSPTAFGAASSGVATLATVNDPSADNSGTATDWRMRQNGGTVIMSGPTTTSNTGATITFTATAQNAGLNAINTLVNTGGGTAVLELTTTADTGFTASPKICTINLASTAFNAASGGSMTLAATSPTNTAVAGTIGRFRIVNKAGAQVLDGLVSTSGSDLNINNTVVGVGSTITISSFSLSLPATGGNGCLIFTGGLAFTAGETVEVSGTFTQPA